MDRVASLSLTLADAAAAVSADPATQGVADAANEVAQGKSGGFFGPIAGVFEATLKVWRPWHASSLASAFPGPWEGCTEGTPLRRDTSHAHVA